MGHDHRPIMLITGASSGIGWSTAKALTRGEGYRVALIARREDRLTSLSDQIGVAASLAPALGPILDRFGRLIAERRLRPVADTLKKRSPGTS